MLEKWLSVGKSLFDILSLFGVALIEMLQWIGLNCPKTAIIAIVIVALLWGNRNAARKFNHSEARVLEERGKMVAKQGFAGLGFIAVLVLIAGLIAVSSGQSRSRTSHIDSIQAVERTQNTRQREEPDISQIRSLPERRDRK